MAVLRILLTLPFIGLAIWSIYHGHRYVVMRLVTDPGMPTPFDVLMTGVVWAGFASMFAQPLGERLLPHGIARFIAWPASLWMGFGFLLIVFLGISDLAWWLLDLAGVPLGVEALVWRAWGIGLLTLGVGIMAIRNGLGGPRDLRVEVTPKGWPRALDGFRIAQISDIHIGPILDRRFAEELTRRVNALQADVVAVTGDLVDGRLDLLRDEVAPFAELRGRLGVFFVTGNHDHYSGANAWASHVETLGMKTLRNERVTLGEGEGAFELAGVDDHRSRMTPAEGGEDLDKALAELPVDRPTVLLAHDPGTFKRASKMGIALQISGHTHDGQIWPFRYMVRLATPFVAGLYRRGEAQIYVSRGTGFWGPPMRLGAPAEITEIVLRSKTKPPAQAL